MSAWNMTLAPTPAILLLQPCIALNPAWNPRHPGTNRPTACFSHQLAPEPWLWHITGSERQARSGWPTCWLGGRQSGMSLERMPSHATVSCLANIEVTALHRQPVPPSPVVQSKWSRHCRCCPTGGHLAPRTSPSSCVEHTRCPRLRSNSAARLGAWCMAATAARRWAQLWMLLRTADCGWGGGTTCFARWRCRPMSCRARLTRWESCWHQR
jgi:hypothetical protein